MPSWFMSLISMGALGYGGTLMFLLLLSSLEDVKQSVKKTSARFNESNSNNPLVSVLVHSQNDELTINESLRSIVESSYSSCEIVVVDNCSSDETKKIVKEFSHRNSEFNIRLVAKRKKTSSYEALRYAAKRWAKGDYVLTLDGSTAINTNSVNELINTISTDSQYSSVTSECTMVFTYSFTGLIANFSQLTHGYVTKALRLVGIKLHSIGASGTLYSKDAFLSLKGVQRLTTEGEIMKKISTKKEKVSWSQYHCRSAFVRSLALDSKMTSRLQRTKIFFATSVVSASLSICALYLAYTQQSFYPLFIIVSSNAIWLLLTIWSNISVGFIDRLRLTVVVPSLLVLEAFGVSQLLRNR